MRINFPALAEDVRLSFEARLKQGDTEAVQAIIKSYVPLAYKISKPYRKQYPSVAEDIVASAMVGLSLAVVRAQEHWKHDNLISYLSPFIKRHICNFLSGLHPITVSRWYLDKGVKLPEFVSLDYIDEVYEQKPIDPVERYFEDMMLTRTERMILLERLQGKNLREIGRLFNKSEGWVRIRIREIQTKYYKAYGK